MTLRTTIPRPSVENRLATVREQRGLSAAHLAKTVGVSRQTIYAIEAGNYVPNTIVGLRLARALGVTLEELFSLAEPECFAKSGSQTAVSLPSARHLSPGQPVQLCRIDHELVATAPARSSFYLPDSDGLVERPAGRSGKLNVKVFDQSESFAGRLLIAGCDPSMTRLARYLRPAGIELVLVHRNSSQSLRLLKEGRAHIAGTHVQDPNTGDPNIEAVTRLFGKESAAVISFAVWEEGLVTAMGNPKEIKGIADLARDGVTIVNREHGAATRLLLHSLLERHRVSQGDIRGYHTTAAGHLAAAHEIKIGKADCCIATEVAARNFGLTFLPLAHARYDLVIRKQDLPLPAIQKLLNLLQQSDFRASLHSACHYDTSITGARVV